MILVFTIIFAAIVSVFFDILYKYILGNDIKKYSIKLISLLTAAQLIGIYFLNTAKLLSFDIQKILNQPFSSFFENCFYSIIISSLCIYVAIKLKTKKDDIKVKQIFKHICLFLAVAFFLEFFLFNFTHYQLVFGKYETLTYPIESISKIYLNEDEEGYLSANKDSQTSLEITNINKEIKNIFIDVEDMSKNDITFNFMMTDESNSEYFFSPQQKLVKDIKKSNYHTLSLNGKSDRIKILFTGQEAFEIKVNSISLNVERPLEFSYLRFFIAFFLLLLIYYLRPRSKIYNLTYNNNNKRQRAAIIGVLILQIVFLFFIARTSVDLNSPPIDHYQDLGSRLLQGHVDMSATPPKQLEVLENPYDFDTRTEYYLWDMTYYNGHYYFYYGVVPAILLYAPYRAVTNTDLPTYMACFIFAAGATIALYKILKLLIERYFKKIPFIVFLMSLTLVLNSSMITYLLRRPRFYEVMELGGLFFVVTGLFFWLKSISPNNNIIATGAKTLVKTKIDKNSLLLGSLCMALSVGCRPSLLFVSFLAFPIFGNYVYENFGLKERKLNFSKSNLVNLSMFCIPFVVVGILLMIYNYVRYDSPFQFGIIYQLSIVETTEFKLTQFQRLFEELIVYLFTPPNISLDFPFIRESGIAHHSYNGKVAVTSNFVGAFFNLILLLLFLAPNIKRFLSNSLKNNDKKFLKKFVWFLIAIGLALIVLATLKGGLVMRYMVDVMWLWLIAAIIIFYAIYEYAQKSKLLFFVKRFFILCFITGMLLNICTSVIGEQNNLYVFHPNLFYKLKYLFSFWL